MHGPPFQNPQTDRLVSRCASRRNRDCLARRITLHIVAPLDECALSALFFRNREQQPKNSDDNLRKPGVVGDAAISAEQEFRTML